MTGLPLSLPGRPREATFYPVSAADLEVDGDELAALAALLLHGDPSIRDANTTAIARCISAGDWNRYFYGVQEVSQWASDESAPRLAFEKQNQNALSALRNGRWPVRAVEGGPMLPPSQRNDFGALWLPRIIRGGGPTQLATAGGEQGPVTCADLDPPRALLDSLDGLVPDWAKPKGPQA